MGGRPAVIIGHREGEMNLVVFTWDKEASQYQWQLMDTQCGSANILKFTYLGKDYILSANREIDEVALYKVKCDS